ncbi:MAG: outer membrane protein transport protein [Sideroxyarcus sp.]|nr:outer membrane protein transport protein [Sideroxyarcus sp.]
MSGNAAASAFALIEQSSGLGNAFAGGAAAAEDATTIFFNPAGMSRLKGKQATVAGSLIVPAASFSGTVTPNSAPFQTPGTNMGGDAGGPALVPNTYMVMEIEPALRFGMGINVPFGLQTKYDENWVGRYQGIKSKLQAVNLNPSLSYEVNETVSLGIGLNYQHITGELTSMINYPAAIFQGVLLQTGNAGTAAAAATPYAGVEGISTLTGSDSAWGYNLGVLFKVTPQTRIGVAYRSSIKYDLDGTVTFANRPAALDATLPNQDVTLAIDMPDSFAISAFHQMDDKWDIMADATRTGWGSFKELNVKKTDGTSLSNTPENWEDTWRVSLGASYHYNEQWMARVGVAYDQTPVPDEYRTVRIPDADRTWLALGGQYKLSTESTLDFGYAHLFVKDATLNQSAAANPDLLGKGYLTGSYSSSVDILSVQYAYNF